MTFSTRVQMRTDGLPVVVGKAPIQLFSIPIPNGDTRFSVSFFTEADVAEAKKRSQHSFGEIRPAIVVISNPDFRAGLTFLRLVADTSR